MTCERPTSDRDLGLFDRNPEGVSLWQLLKEDYRTHGSEFFSQGFWAIAVHRFGNWRMGIRSRLLRLPFSFLYKLLLKCVEWFCGISLNYTVILGRRVHIWHQGGMVLGALSIGNDVHIRQNVTFGVRRRDDPRWLKPTIEDRCDIGAGAVIVGGITIGHDSMIGANVVVATDVPPHSLVTAQAPTVRAMRSRQSNRDANE